MKVVHLSTYSGGGAAIACLRLHRGLIKEGISSQVLFRQLGHCDEGREVHPRPSSLPKKVLQGIRDRFFWNENVIRKNDKRCEIFTSPFSNYDLRNAPEVKEANIVHLHWISDFINYPNFFKANKKIVWTIHDLNPFMGGLHYTVDEQRISTELLKYELRLREYKHSFIRGKGIHFVFLSKWLYEEACRLAPWLKNENAHFIYNGIDTDVFRYKSLLDSKDLLNLPRSKKILLFVADNVNNYRKGFDFLRQVLTKEYVEKNHIYPIAIGYASDSDLEYVSFAGSIHNPDDLSNYYSASDVYVLPSRQDNLPNVMLEALLSGCPVVAHKTGGMSECIDEENGFLFDNFEVREVQEAIEKLLANNLDRRCISSKAARIFAIGMVTKRYIDLYKEILKT